MVITDGTVRKRFSKAAIEGRITCSECLDIARDLGIERSEIASTLTEMGIKIVQCQLGCFK